jgi:hypothetical protein
LNLQTLYALRNGCDNLIGGRQLDPGRYNVDETVTLNVMGMVTRDNDTQCKPSLPSRKALAYLLDKDEDLRKAYAKALKYAIDNEGEKDLPKIKRGIAQLEIVESKVIEDCGLEKTPKCGATKVRVDVSEIGVDGELSLQTASIGSLLPK